MQLPAFIARILGFAEKAEAQLDAIAKANTDTVDLRAQVAKLTSERASAEAQFSKALLDEQAKNAEATASILAKDAEITALKSGVEKEKNRANEVISGQGLPAEQLPTAIPSMDNQESKTTNWTHRAVAANRTLK